MRRNGFGAPGDANPRAVLIYGCGALGDSNAWARPRSDSLRTLYS
jgi:hypothetical protein